MSKAKKHQYDEEFEPINDTPENIARALFGQPVEAPEKSTEQSKEGGEMVTRVYNPQMITPNDKEYFYKYCSSSSTKLILSNCSLKWTSPVEFNDPFDNQFNLHIDEDEDKEGLAQKLNAKFIQAITSDEATHNFESSAMGPLIEFMRKTLKERGRDLIPEIKKGSLEAAKEGVANMIASNARTNQEIHSALKNTTILCLTESHDNLLMWAHYAQNHTGAVIKLLSVKEVDSPLCLAQKVRYSNKMPRLNHEDIFEKQKFIEKIINSLTLTKGIDWAYEKEWRIVSSLRDKSKTSEIISFAPEELGAVYLGCKMTNEDKQEIIETTNKYPNAEIFQAKKHEKEFSLVFEKIH